MSQAPGPLPFAVTMGDPAGIGPEIIAMAYREAPEIMRGSFVVGDVGCLRRAASFAARGGVALPVAELGSPADLAGRSPARSSW